MGDKKHEGLIRIREYAGKKHHDLKQQEPEIERAAKYLMGKYPLLALPGEEKKDGITVGAKRNGYEEYFQVFLRPDEDFLDDIFHNRIVKFDADDLEMLNKNSGIYREALRGIKHLLAREYFDNLFIRYSDQFEAYFKEQKIDDIQAETLFLQNPEGFLANVFRNSLVTAVRGNLGAIRGLEGDNAEEFIRFAQEQIHDIPRDLSSHVLERNALLAARAKLSVELAEIKKKAAAEKRIQEIISRYHALFVEQKISDEIASKRLHENPGEFLADVFLNKLLNSPEVNFYFIPGVMQPDQEAFVKFLATVIPATASSLLSFQESTERRAALSLMNYLNEELPKIREEYEKKLKSLYVLGVQIPAVQERSREEFVRFMQTTFPEILQLRRDNVFEYKAILDLYGYFEKQLQNAHDQVSAEFAKEFKSSLRTLGGPTMDWLLVEESYVALGTEMQKNATVDAVSNLFGSDDGMILVEQKQGDLVLLSLDMQRQRQFREIAAGFLKFMQAELNSKDTLVECVKFLNKLPLSALSSLEITDGMRKSANDYAKTVFALIDVAQHRLAEAEFRKQWGKNMGEVAGLAALLAKVVKVDAEEKLHEVRIRH